MPLTPSQVISYVTFEGSLEDKAVIEEIRVYVDSQPEGLPVNIRTTVEDVVFTIIKEDTNYLINRRFLSERRRLRKISEANRRTKDKGPPSGEERRHEERRHVDLGHAPEPLPDPKELP